MVTADWGTKVRCNPEVDDASLEGFLGAIGRPAVGRGGLLFRVLLGREGCGGGEQTAPDELEGVHDLGRSKNHAAALGRDQAGGWPRNQDWQGGS